MDLSKAFHTINQPLFLAKLHGYGFRKQTLALLCCYLSSRKQRINKDQCFQFLKGFNIRCASRIRPLLFNIYLNDLFFFLKYVGTCNFSHDTTTYISDGSLENVLKSLKKNSMLAITWFENNYIKLNTGKCHLIVSGYKLE